MPIRSAAGRRAGQEGAGRVRQALPQPHRGELARGLHPEPGGADAVTGREGGAEQVGRGLEVVEGGRAPAQHERDRAPVAGHAPAAHHVAGPLVRQRGAEPGDVRPQAEEDGHGGADGQRGHPEVRRDVPALRRPGEAVVVGGLVEPAGLGQRGRGAEPGEQGRAGLFNVDRVIDGRAERVRRAPVVVADRPEQRHPRAERRRVPGARHQREGLDLRARWPAPARPGPAPAPPGRPAGASPPGGCAAARRTSASG